MIESTVNNNSVAEIPETRGTAYSIKVSKSTELCLQDISLCTHKYLVLFPLLQAPKVPLRKNHILIQVSSSHILTGNVEEKEEDTGNENLRVNSTTRWV